MRHYHIRTFGCQMNEHDSQKMGLLLEAEGYRPTPNTKHADIILFNTCTIREKAAHKAMSELGKSLKLKKRREELIVGICGCAAQQYRKELFRKFPTLDMIFGPDQIGQLPDLIGQAKLGVRRLEQTELINSREDYRFLNVIPNHHNHNELSPGAGGKGSALVTIMKGCDSNCSYCIVPSVRGREVCRPADEIVAEVAALANLGIGEVTLLGQTVNTYGNRRHEGNIAFPALLRRVASETDIKRIRFFSPHPKDLNDDLIQAFVDLPKLGKYMHLPVQSGSNKVLRQMKRSYTRESFLQKVEALKKAVPDIAIGTDFIVGFPGESEEDFAQTLALAKEVGFAFSFSFKYSPRPGTFSADNFTDEVPEEVKKERLARLLELTDKLEKSHLDSHVGKVEQILVEGESRKGGQYSGRNLHFNIVNFTADECQAGDEVPVNIERAGKHTLEGEIV